MQLRNFLENFLINKMNTFLSEKRINIDEYSIFFVFHRIDTQPSEFDSLSYKQFKKFISSLRISENISGRKICLTLDDGYLSDFEVALPLSLKYKLPFISFIPTSNIDKKGFLSRNNVYDLSKNGFLIGSHSHKHERIKSQTINKWKEDVYKSKCILEDIISKEIESFSFPFGEYSLAHKNVLKEIGFKFIFNSKYSYRNKIPNNDLIPRIAINKLTPNYLYEDFQSYSISARLYLYLLENIKLIVHNTLLSKIYFSFRK